jgi:hypothetical protein
MAKQTLTAQDALDLAERFHDLAVVTGKYRFDNWDDLSPAQRKALEDGQWSLLNASSDMVTVAVGIVLDTSATSLKNIQAATDEAKKTLKTLKNVKKAIRVATAAVALAAAIASKDPGAIAKNAQGLYDAATADS